MPSAGPTWSRSSATASDRIRAPVVLFYAEGRPLTGELDGRLRWHRLAGTLEAYGVPAGDSGQLLTEPHVRVLAAQLAACMRRLARRAPRMILRAIVPRHTWGLAIAAVAAGVARRRLRGRAHRADQLGPAPRRPFAQLLLAGFAGLLAAKIASQAVARVLLDRFTQRTLTRLCRDLTRQVLATPLRRLEDVGIPRILATLTDDVAWLGWAAQNVPALATNLAMVAGCSLYLGWLSWSTLLALLRGDGRRGARLSGAERAGLPVSAGGARHPRRALPALPDADRRPEGAEDPRAAPSGVHGRAHRVGDRRPEPRLAPRSQAPPGRRHLEPGAVLRADRRSAVRGPAGRGPVRRAAHRLHPRHALHDGAHVVDHGGVADLRPGADRAAEGAATSACRSPRTSEPPPLLASRPRRPPGAGSTSAP